MSATDGERVPRALVVDDEPLVRKGLGCALRERRADVRVCEARDLDSAVAAASACGPDLILLDADLAGRKPATVIPVLDAVAPQARIVVLARQTCPRDARAAFSAGADGYVAKDAGTVELARALDAVEGGGKYLDPRVGASLAGENVAPPRWGSLTERERRVLDLVALGMTNREVAAELGLSLRTIEASRARAQRKLDLHSRSDVVAYVRSA